eukprot:s1290_g7.t1
MWWEACGGRGADKSHDGILDFYELLDVLMTLPPQKADTGAAKSKAEHPNLGIKVSWFGGQMSIALMRDDARDDIQAALEKEEGDRQEWMEKVHKISSEMKELKDEETRHKAFREKHAKAMREHYAKTGQLAI